jgi:hypothetical protein
MILGHTNPSEPPTGSELLGFDVAEASWISGLNNCGYTAEDKEQLQPTWSRRLNEFGLLKTYEDAAEFKGISDRRAQEDAPFWVFSISRVPG